MGFHTISLCSGYGGLDLGIGHALGWASRTVCYVEREAFAQALLVERMEEASLDLAPIWDDLTTFRGRDWRGLVSMVTGGYPCQPYSQAGKRTGDKHQSYLWPHVLRVLIESEAPVAFFENVRGHLKNGFPDVKRDLENCGFTVEPTMLGAEDVGAPHGRQRLFFLAYSDRGGLETVRRMGLLAGVGTARRGDPDGQPCPSGSPPATPAVGVGLADPDGTKLRHEPGRGPWPSRPRASIAGHDGSRLPALGDALGVPEGQRLEGRNSDRGHADERLPWATSTPMEWPPGPDELEQWAAALATRPDLEPAILRMAHGTPTRVDRLRALGNGVVPKQASKALRLLVSRVLGKIGGPEFSGESHGLHSSISDHA